MYSNSLLHRDRGWCFFEQAAGMVVKDNRCLLDFAAFNGATEFGDYRDDPETCTGQMRAGRSPYRGARSPNKGRSPYKGRSPNKFGDANSSGADTSVSQMRVGHTPPTAPDVFGAQMRARVASGALIFSSSVDMEFVIGQYERGFVAAINRLAAKRRPELNFEFLGWGDDEAAVLQLALRYAAAKCTFPRGPVRVAIGGNHFSKEAMAKLPPCKKQHGEAESAPGTQWASMVKVAWWWVRVRVRVRVRARARARARFRVGAKVSSPRGHPPLQKPLPGARLPSGPERRALAAWVPKRGRCGALVPAQRRSCCCL